MKEIIHELAQYPQESALLLQSSLKNFIKVFHFYLYNKPFIFKKFHNDVICALEDITFQRNTRKNLLVNIPVRSGKTQILKYYQAWCYAINPQCNFILTSYGHQLAMRSSQEVRDLIQTELYKKLFKIDFDETMTAKELWKIKGGGELRACSIGGTITGFGAGVIGNNFGGALIIDDPLKADDYKSAVEKQNCIDFYVNTLKTRLNNPDTPIILIMQRLAKDDLSGWIMENEPEDWRFIKIQALQESGLSFWEDKFPAEELKKLKLIHPYTFYSQYQQEPIILGGEVINPEWFNYYQLNQDMNFKKIVISADTAMSVKEANDYSCFMVGGVTQTNQLHILDIVHGKWEYPELKQTALNLYNKWQLDKRSTSASALYIENKASGIQLIQDFKKNGLPAKAIDVTKDKLSRVEEILEFIATGQVLLPVSAQYGNNPALLAECEAFRRDLSQKHDDMVDTLVHLINNAIARRTVSLLEVL